ncbi:T/G mismatch-specific endonuclease [Pseudonocardia cypriaca]|uniref:T/G mismatch-specific endonuclease n=2 Tax=Pseudonocardia cypriaca TaxID=882449 RepID=A0A543FQB8_9PSEU|nr:T/G mismatch-specific endonuclease [Pseudonocardia cypriaca]
MRANRRRDTTPELLLRRALHARGWRYRVDAAVLPGLRRRADIVFARQRVAVFVDGCFWHACPVHGTESKANKRFWADKLAANRRRDEDTDRRLIGAGWTVVRVWEHEDVPTAVEKLEEVLRRSVDPRRPRGANPRKAARNSSDLTD